MISQTFQTGEHQSVGNHVHEDYNHTPEQDFSWVKVEDSPPAPKDLSWDQCDHPLPFCDDLSWVQLGDGSNFAAEDQDRTPEHGLAQSNDDDQATPYECPHASASTDDGEVEFSSRAYRHPDQLPEAWCVEAERETPEPEETLNARSNPLNRARSAIKSAGLLRSAAHPSPQLDLIFKPKHFPEIVYGLELRHDAVTEEMVHRKKVLKNESVDGTRLQNVGKNTQGVRRWKTTKEMVKRIVDAPQLSK